MARSARDRDVIDGVGRRVGWPLLARFARVGPGAKLSPRRSRILRSGRRRGRGELAPNQQAPSRTSWPVSCTWRDRYLREIGEAIFSSNATGSDSHVECRKSAQGSIETPLVVQPLNVEQHLRRCFPQHVTQSGRPRAKRCSFARCISRSSAISARRSAGTASTTPKESWSIRKISISNSARNPVPRYLSVAIRRKSRQVIRP